jgi:hypothetical protein
VDTSGYAPLDFFLLFFPNEAFDLISEQTNRYAQVFLNTSQLPKYSRFLKWQDTSPEEIKAFIALQISMGLCQKNEIEDYWENWWLTNTAFGKVMSRDKYELLSSFLHFADNSVQRPKKGEDGYDFLWKIRDLMTLCESQYEKVYQPSCHLSIDESMIAFKGRVAI